MKILLVHNFHGSDVPSGENTVFETEKRLLETAGHTVDTHTRSNDEIKHSAPLTKVMHGLRVPWSALAAAAMRRKIAAFKPDVVHFHNTFPLLSPAVIHAAHDSGCAVVATLHNYRIVCANSGLLRAGRICTECLDRGTPWSGVRYGCWHSGRLATLPVSIMIALQKALGTYSEHVDAVIVLTAFQRELVMRSGLPSARLHVKPNFTPVAPAVPWPQREDKVIFVGRVSPEKGLQSLLDAWQRLGSGAPRLEIVGGGIFLEQAKAEARRLGIAQRVEFCGQCSHEEAMQRLSRARLLVFPSIWYEPFGLSIAEAYARRVPVLCSALGSLPDLVQDGVSGALFAAGDPDALAHGVERLWQRQDLLEQMAACAHAAWLRHFTPEANLAALERIYREARSRNP